MYIHCFDKNQRIYCQKCAKKKKEPYFVHVTKKAENYCQACAPGYLRVYEDEDAKTRYAEYLDEIERNRSVGSRMNMTGW